MAKTPALDVVGDVDVLERAEAFTQDVLFWRTAAARPNMSRKRRKEALPKPRRPTKRPST